MPAGVKVGLNDHLCAHPIEALTRLPLLGLKRAVFARTAGWWREWTRRKEEPPALSGPTVLEML